MDENFFWADNLAEQSIERAKKEGKIATIRSGQTPSGGKHIGNLNDILRAYFVYKSIINKGHESRLVNTSDDRDPLKNIPKRLADLDGKWHDSSKFRGLKKHLGMPLVLVPDPFGCCKSYAEHFDNMWKNGLKEINVKVDSYSNDELYKKGKYDKYIITVFEKINEAGKIISKHQETKSENYIPFDAICPSCNRLANIKSFDIKEKTVEFVCGGKSIKSKKSEGCGFSGAVPFSQGKLQWRFEWPAQWGIFETIHEPFGKDHFEGSWKSGQEIAGKIYGIEPPIPFVYEFFLVNNEKMSASKGNVYIIQDMMKIIEPEVFMYFYTKRPNKQRNFDLKNINYLVDDFERTEQIYYGVREEKNENNKKAAIRYYEAVSNKMEKMPVRIPYNFAALLSSIGGDTKRAVELLKFTGHIKGEVSKEDKKRIEKRIELAGNWLKLYNPDMKISVNEKIPEIDFSSSQKKSVKTLITELKKSRDEKELQSRIYDIARENNMEPKEFFKLMYKIMINKDSGPRLGPFMVAIGKKKVVDLLKQI